MARQWIFGALLLACVLLGKACMPYDQCVHEDSCLERAPAFTYRSALCKSPFVCCTTVKKDIEKNLFDNADVPLEGTRKPPRGDQLHTTTSAPAIDSDDDGDLCGLSNRNGLDSRVQVSGDQARSGEFPWAITLFSKGQYIGGGSLIAPGVVLTAAHLLLRHSEADIMVRAGEWDLSTTTEQFAHEERQVKKIVRHEGFEYSSGGNNLALLFLNTPFAIQDHIQTICLPSKVQSFEGKRCIVAGWGRRSFPETRNSNILKKIELPMVNRATCQTQLRNTVLGGTFNLAPSLICAGGELDEDACLGDGGSALFCALEEDPDRYEQAGIVVWGIECGKQDVPATYTNVAMFREWINLKLAENNAQPRKAVSDGPPPGFAYRITF